LLYSIERTTNKKIPEMHLPSAQTINDSRIDRFKSRIVDALQMDELDFYQQLIEQVETEQNVPAIEIAAALARMIQGDVPFFIQDKPMRETSQRGDRGDRDDRGGRNERRGRNDRNERADRGERGQRGGRDGERSPRRRQTTSPDEGMKRYRLEVGRSHGVRPGNIVGCIANEANIDSEFIRQLNIEDSFSTVDLPDTMPKEVFNDLSKAWVCGQQLRLSQVQTQSDGKKRLKSHSKKPSQNRR